jgi:hypothetical protein
MSLSTVAESRWSVKVLVHPSGERLVAGDRDRGALLEFGEDLEQQLGAAAVEFPVSQLIEAERVDADM